MQIGQPFHTGLPLSFCAEAEEGEEGSADGEGSGQEHGVMGSLVPEKMEEQGHQGGSDSLTCKAGRGKHTARAAGPVIGSGAEQHVVVGRLEETEAGPTHHQPPCDIQM